MGVSLWRCIVRLSHDADGIWKQPPRLSGDDSTAVIACAKFYTKPQEDEFRLFGFIYTTAWAGIE